MMIDKNYSKEQYIQDVENLSLDEVWDKILSFIKNNGETDFLKVNALGDLYELGLSIKDKNRKKENGIYYTPKDVSDLMADFCCDFIKSDTNICDVCAGTGNLIISVLSAMGKIKRKALLTNGHIFLYDMDELALKIARWKIGYLFGYEYMKKVNVICGDFLSQKVLLPNNNVVISNPPYFKITEVKDEWEKTPLLMASKEYYGVFMEKCIKLSRACVFITPYSFVSGLKFYELRKLLNNTKSKIFVFDNVPGNIFKGKKHGVFNSNTSNATRAAISIIDTTRKKGASVSPMIRFLTSEREKILARNLLESLIDEKHYQKVNDKDKMYYKCFPEDIDTFLKWKKCKERFGSLLSDEPTEYKLDMPTTCRYFTAATRKSLNRDGKHTLYFKDEESRNYAYILLNSSFAYWYWRIYDGAITYATSLLNNMPIKYKLIEDSTHEYIKKICEDAMNRESEYLVYKQNAKKLQENIKIPNKQRDIFNEVIINNLGIEDIDFKKIHNSSFFS